MKVFKINFLFFYIALCIGLIFNAFSHQGGLNSEGCHNNTKTDEYHCHTYNPDRRDDGFRVVDGDTVHFDFDKMKVRFSGIDAPEMKQICYENEQPLRCGEIATLKLKEFIGEELPTCVVEDQDRYGRMVAECFVQGKSISEYLVRNGYAFAYRQYSKKFVKDEEYAKENNLGFWNTEFEFPWDYRKK